MTERQYGELQAAVHDEVQAYCEKAAAAPYPDDDALMKLVYAEGGDGR